MLVQRGLEWFFDPALNAPPDGRDAGSTGDSAAGAAESTPVRDTGSTEASAAAAAEYTQAAMGKQIEAGQRQLAAVQASDGAPCAPLPRKVSKSGSFLGGVLGRSSETSLLKLPPKAAALEAFLLLSRV